MVLLLAFTGDGKLALSFSYPEFILEVELRVGFSAWVWEVSGEGGEGICLVLATRVSHDNAYICMG